VSIYTLDGIYYKNEDELNPALSNKSNKLRLGSRKSNFGLVRTLMVGVKSNETHQDLKGSLVQ
jgi:hypothetical protein